MRTDLSVTTIPKSPQRKVSSVPPRPLNGTRLAAEPAPAPLGGKPSGRVQIAAALAARFLPEGIVLLVVALLATYNLQYYPRIWFDEGMNLVAARDFAEQGRYGIQYAEGFHLFDFTLSTGPTVIVPVAAAFKVFGVGLVQARAVSAVYLLVAALGLYLNAKYLYGRTVGLLAILAFAALTQVGAFAHGRNVVGELAAIAFVLWGAFALIRARIMSSAPLYVMAGFLLGLAILTKNQFIILAPVLVAVWMLGRGRATALSLGQVALLLAALSIPMLAWYLCWAVFLGPDVFLDRMRSMAEIAQHSSYVAPLSVASRSLNVLASSGVIACCLPGLLYVWLLALREEWYRQPERIFLPTFAAVWLGWFLVMSIGYARYAAPVALISTIFVAKFADDLVRHWMPIGSPLSPTAVLAKPLGAMVLAVLSLASLTGISQNALAVVRANDDSPQRFAAMVTEQVEPGAIVDSAEWEIKFLTRAVFSHPSVPLVNDAVAVVYLGKPMQSLDSYQPSQSASYVVDGPFSKLVGLYRGSLSRGLLQPVASYGEYDLYRRR